MFKRVDSSIFKERNLNENVEYNKMLTLYRQSLKHESTGNIKESTDTYLEALMLQRNGRSKKISTYMLGIPRVLWTKIFFLLDGKKHHFYF